MAATALVAVLGSGGCRSVSDRSIREIGLADVQRPVQRGDRESTLVIDARPAEAYLAGHIPGAVNMRLPDVDLRDPDPALGRYKLLVVYGEDPGSASARGLTKRLLSAKFKNARLFSGGMQAWRTAGLPEETGAGGRP